MAYRLLIRQLGIRAYPPVAHAMREFTDQRTAQTPDELWLVQHYPVFTQGQTGKAAHLLNPGAIPVVQSDRGGQVTYHGPGQQILYVLLDLRRYQLGVRPLVTLLEQTVINTLHSLAITAQSRADAPGVYISGQKICSLGLRIRRGCSLHGLALNVAMDLQPFSRINPCGYAGLRMTQVRDHCAQITCERVCALLVAHFTVLLSEHRGLSLISEWLPADNLPAKAIVNECR